MRDQPTTKGNAKALSVAWLAAGTLDITYACVASAFHGRTPMTVLQSVASGWQGVAAYAGGTAAAMLGLLTHYGIMLVMVAIFAIARRYVAALHERPWSAGSIYGLCLYCVMYGIVLPLRFPEVFPRLSGWLTVTDVIVHLSVGLIIAFSFARFAPARRTAS